MKKYLSIYTLLALACIVLQSCLFSEEEIFDESSANRATADVIKCQEILKDVPNGWKLEYYIASSNALVCKDWVCPKAAAIASIQVRPTLLNGSCSVNDHPEVCE